MKRTKTRALTEGAIMVALATALSYVKFFELPNGGSVCIGMVPILIYCIRWGWKASVRAWKRSRRFWNGLERSTGYTGIRTHDIFILHAL